MASSPLESGTVALPNVSHVMGEAVGEGADWNTRGGVCSRNVSRSGAVPKGWKTEEGAARDAPPSDRDGRAPEAIRGQAEGGRKRGGFRHCGVGV